MVPFQLAILVDLLGLGQAGGGLHLPAGWKARAVRGVDPPSFEIATDGDGPLVRIQGTGRAAWFYREVTLATPTPPAGRLRWSWRVLQAPKGASLGEKARDDSPIRIYVVFGKVGGLFKRSGRVIFYSFAGNDPAGYAAASHLSSRLHVIGIDGPAAVGTWHEHQVDPIGDYRRIWGREPEPITAIGVMQDTDQTRQEAVAELRKLEWGETN